MSNPKTLYRTVIRFEVLSETPIPDDMTMGQIEEECDTGSYSGRFLENEVKNEVIEGKAAVEATKAQGSDPAFFNMDEEGNDLEEDELNYDQTYGDKKKVCSECYSEDIRIAMIPDNVGHGLHEGWVCNSCKAEDFEPDLEDIN